MNLVTLVKPPGEGDYFDFDFGPVLRTGDTIASVVGVTATPMTAETGVLSFTAPTFEGQRVQIYVPAGAEGFWKLEAEADSTLGATGKRVAGYLRVVDLAGLPVCVLEGFLSDVGGVNRPGVEISVTPQAPGFVEGQALQMTSRHVRTDSNGYFSTQVLKNVSVRIECARARFDKTVTLTGDAENWKNL